MALQLPAALRADPPTLARRLGISVAAVQFARECEIVDLHVDTFIPPRLWGYGVLHRHRGGPLGHRFFGHLDLPRLRDGGLGGAMWSITTNPFRSPAERWRVFQKNLRGLHRLVDASRGAMAIVRSHEEYRAARARHAHAVMVSIQGGNALEAAPNGPADIANNSVLRVTLVHLTSSVYGATSSPHHLLRWNKGLTRAGAALIEQLNAQRIFVDLAHIHPQAFWDAVRIHDKRQPLLATHTGVAGVKKHWRNLDDKQLRAIADTGGVVGVIFAKQFLQTRKTGSSAKMVLDHMQHVIDTIGEDHCALGSDYDGAIIPPIDLASAECYPVLVDHMLARGWSETRIRKVLGDNALRCLAALRP